MMEDLRKFVFQPIDWRYNSETEKDDKECIITVGGVLENGEDIVCEIYNFKPHIVIELPQEIIRNEETIPIIWTEQLYEKIYNWMRELISDKSDKNQKNRPVKYEILENVKVYQQQRQGNFIKIYFMTHISMAGFRRHFEDKIDDEYVSHSIYCGIFQTVFPAGTFKLHETNINPLIKFIVKQKIIPSGWIEVTEYIPGGSIGCTANERKFSHAIHDCYVYAEDVHPADDKVDSTFRPNIKVMSFDIECFSKNFNSKMPDPSILENEVYSIGACIANIVDQVHSYKTYILSLENPPDVPGVIMLRFKTERDLLIGFGKFIRDNENPYIMLGHNILGFDWDYLIKRAKLAINDCYSQFAEFTKMIDEEADCTKLSWNSKAYQNMVFKYMNPVGRLNFDLMVEAERQGYRLKSFALNSLGEKFLGEFKKDLPYRHQFMIYFLIIRTRRIKSLKKCRKLVKKTIKQDECMDENMNITEIGEWKAKLLDCSADTFRSVIKEGHSLLLEYLKQDVILPMKIFHKMNMWTGAQQASNIFRVPIEYLQTRGQQIKVLAQLYALTSEESTILGFKQYEQQYDWNIQGALVQDIIKGYHKHVLTYDFTSLYPRIIIAFNISYDSFVEDLNVDPETVHIIDWVEHKFCGCPEDPKNGKKGKNDRILCSKNENIGTEHEGHFRFQFKKVVIIRDEKGNIIERRYEGLFPRFLRNLLTKRKGIKKQIKLINKWVYSTDFGSKAVKEKIGNWVVGGDEIESYTKHCSTAQISKEDLEFIREILPKTIYNKPILTKENVYSLLITVVVLDKKQLAVKISANSGYGGLGTETSALCFKPGAACTTAMGRKLITKGIEHTRKSFTAEKLSEIFEHKIDIGFQLVYGDSVMGDEPLLLQNSKGEIEIKTIAELGEESGWIEYCDEKDSDFKPLDSVASNRREKQKSYVTYDVWANGKWNPIKKVIRHKTNKKIFRVSTNRGVVDVTEDHSLLNQNLEKIKPGECIVGETKLSHSYPTFENSEYIPVNKIIDWLYKYENNEYEHFTIEERSAYFDGVFYNNVVPIISILNSHDTNIYLNFFVGYLSTCNYIIDNEQIRFPSLGKLCTAQLYYLVKFLGYNVRVELKEEVKDVYWLTCTIVAEKTVLTDVYELSKNEEEFVYDLETEDGIFQCGVGEIQVKNTDSFMGCFPALTISESWKMIDHIQKELDSGIFPEPIHLEFECMYGKYFQLSKKCYVSWMMEPKVKNVIDDDVKNNWMITDKLQKGVVSSRRDNCRYTTYGFDKLMEMAINDVKTKYEMRNYVADYAYQLMSKGVETKDLIVTKGVGNLEDYEKEDEEGNTTLTNQGHIKLAAKMMHLRGEDVQNTRLQFMFIKRPSEKIRFVDLKQEHVIEDATYYKNKFRKLGLEPYYLYYLTHTIESHFDKILDYKYKPTTIYCEKIVDKLEKEREVLESKIHYSKLCFLNNLLVPVSQFIKIPFLNKDPIKYKLYRQTFLITEHVKVIEQQLNLKSGELDRYIHLLKQRHSANIIKRIQDIYGFTQHGGGERGDKENNHVMIDGTYTKKLIKAHVKYRNVVKDLNKKFVCLNFVDPFKE